MINIKTPEQIEGIRKSSQLAAQTLKFIAPFVIAGVTTYELDQKIEAFMREHGATPATLNYKGYPKSCCISVNEVICHGIPDQTVLKDGDIVNIDVTPVLNGYYGDTCKMFTVGPVSEEAQRLLDVSYKCLLKGIMEVRPDNRFGNIGYAITQHAEANGYSVVHQFCGHGVGIEFHEEPQVNHYALHRNTGPKMKEGMVFTIEPMLNQKSPNAIILEDGWTAVTEDGGLSAQFEHTVLVTKDGVEILTI